MPPIKLNDVGFNISVELFGDVKTYAGHAPAVILLAEHHKNNDVKGQNLQSALNLIDSRVVGVVGVEQYLATDDIKDRLMQSFGPRKAGSLAAYGEQLLVENGGEPGFIANVRASNDEELSFARNLVFLCPDIEIVGIEDPDLRQQAQAASQLAATLFPEVADPIERRKLQIKRFREDGVQRELARDAAFLANAFEAQRRLGTPNAIVLNIGGLHAKRMSATLRERGHANVLIIPMGYVVE